MIKMVLNLLFLKELKSKEEEATQTIEERWRSKIRALLT